MEQERSEQGTVLIFSLCILALMSLFALTFVRLVNFERVASTNYTDSVRARMLARAGIARAVVELQDIAGRRHYSDPLEDEWEFALKRPSTMSQTEQENLALRLDLLTTTKPSFLIKDLRVLKAQDSDPDPTMFQAPLAVSGLMGRSYENGLDVYKLKVVDCASQLNVNHPDEVTITRMLKYMLRATAEQTWGLSLDDTQSGDLATAVIDGRPAAGFLSKSEVKALLVSDSGPITEEIWNKSLRDKVTVLSWVDEKVIRPWNLNGESTQDLPVMARAPININTASRPVLVSMFAGLEARNDYGTFRLGYTNAKNIADRIIRWRTVYNTTNPYAGAVSNSEFETSLGVRLRKGPFRSWVDFENFVDHRLFIDDYDDVEVPADGGQAYIAANPSAPDENWQGVKSVEHWAEGLVPHTDYEDVSPTWRAINWGQGIRDMIKAQVNPNTMLNKFGQPAHHGGLRANGLPLPRLVDKSDLYSMSTEGCLDAMGVYEITSVGMVLVRDPGAAEFYADFLDVDPKQDGEMTVIAQQTQQVVVRVYDVVRYTTQSDFEKYRAFMLPGEFIPDVQEWRKSMGINRVDPMIMGEDIKDDVLDGGEEAGVPAWPGLISHPTYSMVRRGDALHEIGSAYVPSEADGSLTLTNLLGVDAKASDFIAGFARGSINAFKCRVWWDPKDQDVYGVENAQGEPFIRNGGFPSHPLGIRPPPETEGSTAEWWDQWFAGEVSVTDPRPHRNPPWPDTGLVVPNDPTGGIKFSAENLQALTDAQPGGTLGGVPRTTIKDGNERGPLASDPTATPTEGQWWHDGASLWNGGVAIGPRRGAQDPLDSRKPVLIYSGDNIDLERASSIRFWVQPLGDPYLREEEVLLSFVGSRDGQRRDAGFRVRKTVSGNGDVWIRLESIPAPSLINDDDDRPYFDPGRTITEHTEWCTASGGDGPWDTDPGAAGRPTNCIRHRDYLDWAMVGNPWKARVSLDVKPKVDDRMGAYDDPVPFPTSNNYWSDWGNAGPAGAGMVKMDPLNPEWFANTWHWVVVNYGYARNDDGGVGFAQFDMSLQIDMSPPQPPWALDTVETGRVAFAGDTTLSGANNYWGEMHGHEHAGSTYSGTTRVGEHPNGASDTRVPCAGKDPNQMEPLGIDRQCPNCPYEICGTAEGKVGIDKEHIDFTDHGRIDATHCWMEPRVLGDFYSCRKGSRSVRVNGEPKVIENAVNYTPPVFDPDDPETVLVPHSFALNSNADFTFPIDSFEPKVDAIVNYGDGSDQVIGLSINFGSGAQWQITSMPTYEDIEAKGGISRIDLRLRFKNTEVKGGDYQNPHTTAFESAPNVGDWDGELMHQWANHPDKFPDHLKEGGFAISKPNGNNSCVLGMRVHGRPSALCPVPTQLPCWTVTGTELGGIAWGYNLTGAFLPPSNYFPYSAPPGGAKGVGKFPPDLLCDGCRGCEGCDVDGPLFLGGEPRETSGPATNYDGGVVREVDLGSMAFAVFDNLVIKNRKEFDVRTDFHEGHGDTPSDFTAVDWYEDRYFATSTATEHFQYVFDATATDLMPERIGYGATYRRGLLELFGQRARLGSMTWTSYGTSTFDTSASGGMQFEVKLYNVPGMDGPVDNRQQTWRLERSDLLSMSTPQPSRLVSRSGTFDGGGALTGFTAGTAYGELPASESYYDGLGNGDLKVPEILVLAIQLGGLYSVNSAGEDEGDVTSRSTVTHDGSGGVTMSTGLPTPIYESPVFEDVTLNLIRETAQVLYSEEGIACN